MGKTGKNLAVNISLAFISIIIVLVISEIALRTLFGFHYYYIWPPDLTRIHHPAQNVMRGVEGISKFTINSDGFRGESFSDKYKYNIVSLGGSTTECLYLDDSEAWPTLVQSIINQKTASETIWVGNVGKSGHHSRHHVLQVSKMLSQYPKIDLIVLLVGINDLHLFLSHRDYKEMTIEKITSPGNELYDEAFMLMPNRLDNENIPYFKRTAVWNLLRKVKKTLLRGGTTGEIQDETGNWMRDVRQKRKESEEKLDILPDMSAGLREYARNLNEIINEVNRHGKKIVFATQPVMWETELKPEFEDLLMMGATDRTPDGKKSFFTVRALHEAMGEYNRVLREVCLKNGVDVIDLANIFSGEKDIYYDDCHFNEHGAVRVAEEVSKFLKSRIKIEGE